PVLAALALFAPSFAFADLTADFMTLVKEIQAKIEDGARSPEALAPELKRFDDLIAAHASEKTDDVAQVQFALATLHAGIFGDYEKAKSLLQSVKTNFPDTKYAARVDQTIAMIDAQRAQAAARAENDRMYAVGKSFPDFAEADL